MKEAGYQYQKTYDATGIIRDQNGRFRHASEQEKNSEEDKVANKVIDDYINSKMPSNNNQTGE